MNHQCFRAAFAGFTAVPLPVTETPESVQGHVDVQVCPVTLAHVAATAQTEGEMWFAWMADYRFGLLHNTLSLLLLDLIDSMWKDATAGLRQGVCMQ